MLISSILYLGCELKWATEAPAAVAGGMVGGEAARAAGSEYDEAGPERVGAAEADGAGSPDPDRGPRLLILTRLFSC